MLAPMGVLSSALLEAIMIDMIAFIYKLFIYYILLIVEYIRMYTYTFDAT